MARGLAYVAALSVGLGGCGSSFDQCQAEQIDVTIAATLIRDGHETSATLSGQVSPSNVGVPVFDTLRAVLTGDVTAETAGVIWTVPAFEPEQGWVVIALDAPIATGQVLPVGSTYGGAGWGVFDLPSNTKVAAGIRAGGFAAASVSGSVEVLGVGPLRLRLDLTGRDGTDAVVQVRGDATFAYRSGPPSCT
jgi:hypothetical protein